MRMSSTVNAPVPSPEVPSSNAAAAYMAGGLGAPSPASRPNTRVRTDLQDTEDPERTAEADDRCDRAATMAPADRGERLIVASAMPRWSAL